MKACCTQVFASISFEYSFFLCHLFYSSSVFFKVQRWAGTLMTTITVMMKEEGTGNTLEDVPTIQGTEGLSIKVRYYYYNRIACIPSFVEAM